MPCRRISCKFWARHAGGCASLSHHQPNRETQACFRGARHLLAADRSLSTSAKASPPTSARPGTPAAARHVLRRRSWLPHLSDRWRGRDRWRSRIVGGVEIGGGAEIRRLEFGLGAQWSSRDARARAADIEAACRRRVRSARRSSTAGVGGGTSLRVREESKHIVALFFRHLFSRVRAQGEFGLFGQVALRTGRRERGTTGEDYVE